MEVGLVFCSGAYTGPAQFYLLEPKITEFLLKGEKAMHTIERIARFHLKVERIHPFIDGSSRTGHLVLIRNLILVYAANLQINDIVAINNVFKMD